MAITSNLLKPLSKKSNKKKKKKSSKNKTTKYAYTSKQKLVPRNAFLITGRD